MLVRTTSGGLINSERRKHQLMRKLVPNPIQLVEMRDLFSPVLLRVLQGRVEIELPGEVQIQLRKTLRRNPLHQHRVKALLEDQVTAQNHQIDFVG